MHREEMHLRGVAQHWARRSNSHLSTAARALPPKMTSGSPHDRLES